jgi:hypothetical protein
VAGSRPKRQEGGKGVLHLGAGEKEAARQGDWRREGSHPRLQGGACFRPSADGGRATAFRRPGHRELDSDVAALLDVAKACGACGGTFDGEGVGFLGRYLHGKAIELGVKNLSTWAHELCHAADDRNGSLKEKGQHWRSETVAELGGAVLLEILGFKQEADLGGCWEYIQGIRRGGKDRSSRGVYEGLGPDLRCRGGDFGHCRTDQAGQIPDGVVDMRVRMLVLFNKRKRRSNSRGLSS